MILRRITEHVKAQNWFAVGLDFFIVVVGVFIGIQVANWNDARVERSAEKVYLAALEQDVVSSLEDVEQTLARLEMQSEILSELYDYSINSDVEYSNDEWGRKVGVGLFHIAAINVNQVTFDTLKSSGQMTLIGEPALVRELQELQTDLNDIVTREESEAETTVRYIDPYLIEQFELANVFIEGNFERLNKIPWLAAPPSKGPANDVMKSLGFRNAVLYKSYFVSARETDVRALLDRYHRIAALIDERQARLGVH